MTAPPNKLAPQLRGQLRGSDRWLGEAPNPRYAGNPTGLNRDYSVFERGLPTTLEIQVSLLNGIRHSDKKAVFVSEAVGYLGGTALGGAEGFDVVLLLKGSSASAVAFRWTFYRFPDRDHALFAAGVIAGRDRIPLIDETEEGRADAPAVLS